MQQEEKIEIKAMIAELRTRYARLSSLCGAQNISRQTKESYAKEIAKLESQLR
jgi:hypothetical protein